MTPAKDPVQIIRQARRVLARARRHQLDLAIDGKIIESARFAQRAHRVNDTAGTMRDDPPTVAADPQ